MTNLKGQRSPYIITKYFHLIIPYWINRFLPFNCSVKKFFSLQNLYIRITCSSSVHCNQVLSIKDEQIQLKIGCVTRKNFYVLNLEWILFQVQRNDQSPSILRTSHGKHFYSSQVFSCSWFISNSYILLLQQIIQNM